MNLTAIGSSALAEVQPRQVAAHAAAVLLVGGGGALTGWLAAGSGRGAMIGAGAHLGLYGVATAMMQAGVARVGWGLLGLAGAGAVGYLLWSRRKGR